MQAEPIELSYVRLQELALAVLAYNKMRTSAAPLAQQAESVVVREIIREFRFNPNYCQSEAFAHLMSIATDVLDSYNHQVMIAALTKDTTARTPNSLLRPWLQFRKLAKQTSSVISWDNVRRNLDTLVSVQREAAYSVIRQNEVTPFIPNIDFSKPFDMYVVNNTIALEAQPPLVCLLKHPDACLSARLVSSAADKVSRANFSLSKKIKINPEWLTQLEDSAIVHMMFKNTPINFLLTDFEAVS
jgi:hypothetical protein